MSDAIYHMLNLIKSNCCDVWQITNYNAMVTYTYVSDHLIQVLHTCSQTFICSQLGSPSVHTHVLSPVYMIQPVVKPLVKPVWQPIKCLYTQYNRLSNRMSSRVENRLYRVYKHSTGCQTRLTTGLTTGCIMYTAGSQIGCITRFDKRLNEQWLFVQHGCQTGLTTGWMFVYMIQPVVKPVWQSVVSCKRGITNISYYYYYTTLWVEKRVPP